MRLKKMLAVLSAAVITMSGAAFAEMSVMTENVFTAESVNAEESKTTEFLNSRSAELRMLGICDGSLSDKTFQMAGRTYNQGMVFAVNNKETYITFNIKDKNIRNLSFDFGHAEDVSNVIGEKSESENASAVLTVEVYGYSEEIITLDPEDGIYRFNSAEHNLRDLSTASEITLRLDSTSSLAAYSYYAFANISVNEEATPGYTYLQYNTPEEFINSSFYTEGVTAHDGKDGTEDYFMKGREYYQGLKIDKSGYACFNVEDLEKIEFTMGQIDNGNHSTMKLTIMLDGEIYDKFDEYEVSWRDMLETVTIDVSNATTLYISHDDSCYEQFIALGDITIDDKTPEEISETKNYANADEFVAAAFNHI